MARAREVRKALKMLLLTGVVCGVASVYWFGDALDAFSQRVTTSDSASERMSSSFLEPLLFLSDPEFLGYGAGATHPGGAGLRARFGLPEPAVAPPEAENETVRVMLELGVFGFLVWYALKLYLIMALWRTRVQTRNPFLKNLALAAFLVHAILFTGTTVLNHTAHVYFWFMAGFIFLLPRLDSDVAHERLENNLHSAGSGNAPLQKLPVATAPGIVKSDRGPKYSHH
jgi:O-antigen ligase